jgi:hypothetical protein
MAINYIYIMRIKLLLACVVSCLLWASCTRDDNDYNNDAVDVVKQWTIPVSATYENPYIQGRTDSGSATLILMRDNSIRYDVNVLNKVGTITSATIRAGGPLTNGPVVLDLNPRITNGYATGVVTNVRQSLVDSLLNNTYDLYFDIGGSLGGVARGQFNLNIVMSANVQLLGTNEVPSITTTTKGNAYLRLTSDKVLYSTVTLSNVEPNDVMTAAHIHKGKPGVNGPIFITLVNYPSEFGVTKRTVVTDAQYNSLLSDTLYINAHSALFPGGKIRGQLR